MRTIPVISGILFKQFRRILYFCVLQNLHICRIQICIFSAFDVKSAYFQILLSIPAKSPIFEICIFPGFLTTKINVFYTFDI